MGVALAAAAAFAGDPLLAVIEQVDRDFAGLGVADRSFRPGRGRMSFAVAAGFVGARAVVAGRSLVNALEAKVLQRSELDAKP